MMNIRRPGWSLSHPDEARGRWCGQSMPVPIPLELDALRGEQRADLAIDTQRAFVHQFHGPRADAPDAAAAGLVECMSGNRSRPWPASWKSQAYRQFTDQLPDIPVHSRPGHQQRNDRPAGRQWIMDPAPSRHLTFSADPDPLVRVVARWPHLPSNRVPVMRLPLELPCRSDEDDERSSPPRHDNGRRRGEVRTHAWLERADGHSTLNVSVSDDGPGIRPRADSPGLGLGIPLMAQLTKALDLAGNGSGVTVRMQFALP